MNSSLILKSKLENACNRFVDFKINRMEAKRKRLIEKERSFRLKPFLIFWGNTKHTDEEIKEILQKESYEYKLTDITEHSDYRAILYVLSLCKVCNSELIKIDSKTAFILSNFFD